MDDGDWVRADSLGLEEEREALEGGERAYRDRERAFLKELRRRHAHHVKVSAAFKAGLATQEEYNEAFMATYRVGEAFGRDPYRQKMIRDGIWKPHTISRRRKPSTRPRS
jgi:hypothetical protein